MLALEEAQRIVLENAAPRPTSRVDLLQALGGILAEEVTADRDQPEFDRSAMDGYAVHSEDVEAAPATLDLHPGVIAAGGWPVFGLDRGRAARIMTGAPLPQGADAVQMIEETQVEGGRVKIFKGVEKWEHVRRRGEDLREGEVAVAAGTRITPAVLGVLASFGCATVRVYDPPIVGVMTTGSELVEYNEVPGPGQIRNSNSLALLGLLYRHGIEGGYIGKIPDEIEQIVEALTRGIESADLLLVTGGASEGDFDLVAAALARIGATVFFHKVAIKPGKPVSFAKRGGKAIFSLPGNPVSAVVAFHLLVDPYIRKITGSADPLPRVYRGRLARPFTKGGARRHFVPAVCRNAPMGLEAEPLEFRGSGDMVAFAKANCMIVVAEGDVTLEAGADVEIQLLEDPRA